MLGVQLAVAHGKVLYSLFDLVTTLFGKKNFSNIAINPLSWEGVTARGLENSTFAQEVGFCKAIDALKIKHQVQLDGRMPGRYRYSTC